MKASDRSYFTALFIAITVLIGVATVIFANQLRNQNAELRSQAAGPYNPCASACKAGVPQQACDACLQANGSLLTLPANSSCNSDAPPEMPDSCERCPNKQWYINKEGRPQCGTPPPSPTAVPKLKVGDSCSYAESTLWYSCANCPFGQPNVNGNNPNGTCPAKTLGVGDSCSYAESSLPYSCANCPFGQPDVNANHPNGTCPGPNGSGSGSQQNSGGAQGSIGTFNEESEPTCETGQLYWNPSHTLWWCAP